MAGCWCFATRVTRQINFSKYIFFEIYLPVIRVFAERALVAFASAPLGTTMFDMEKFGTGDGLWSWSQSQSGKPISVKKVAGLADFSVV